MDGYPKSVWVGIVTDLVIAVVKLLAAAASGSSAMLAEGIHSLIDTGNASLIVWGLKKSKKPPDKNHPFGHGKELYFWALIVALLIFTLGGGVTIFEGIHQIRHPEPLRSLNTGLLVLGIAGAIELGTLWFTLREFRRGEGRRGLWLGIQTSKDPTLFAILMNSAAGLVGVLIAFLGLYLSERLHKPWIDGFASILIGILLGAVAYVMLVEIKGLIVGEGADPHILAEIRLLAKADPAIQMAGYPPHHVLRSAYDPVGARRPFQRRPGNQTDHASGRPAGKGDPRPLSGH